MAAATKKVCKALSLKCGVVSLKSVCTGLEVWWTYLYHFNHIRTCISYWIVTSTKGVSQFVLSLVLRQISFVSCEVIDTESFRPESQYWQTKAHGIKRRSTFQPQSLSFYKPIRSFIEDFVPNLNQIRFLFTCSVWLSLLCGLNLWSFTFVTSCAALSLPYLFVVHRSQRLHTKGYLCCVSCPRWLCREKRTSCHCFEKTIDFCVLFFSSLQKKKRKNELCSEAKSYTHWAAFISS